MGEDCEGYFCEVCGPCWEDEKYRLNLDGHGNAESKNPLDHKRFFEKFVRSKIQEQQEKSWWVTMTSGDLSRKKIRTYVTFKRVFRLEKYLLVNSDARGRAYYTSLRSGTNCLEIEKGRHLGISRDLRLCKSCDTKAVEDEIHFLMHCPLYNQLREKCFKSILNISEGKWDLKSRPGVKVLFC